MTSETKAKVAIAGGGLLGRLLAWRLCQRELDITLFEAGDLSAPVGELAGRQLE
ncbi:hypothetical protein QT397_20395 [Microbulbifer sp. MKSA007]|nr:hypothetical protein QT397_20395 [Microbulbifer sp. MKSA007]